MPERLSKSRKLSDVLSDLYLDLDLQTSRHLEKNGGSSCKIGCTSCCYLLTTIGVAEGIMIAEEVFKRDWKPLVQRIRESALVHCEEGMTPVSHLAKKIPCVFLDGPHCSIYYQRPSCCRYHFVVSYPVLCSPDTPNATTAVINLRGIEETVWKLDGRVAQSIEEFYDRPLFCPIPLMVLFCMEFISRNNPEFQPFMNEIVKGIPTPDEWLFRYGEKIAKSEIESVGPAIHGEELVRLKSDMKERNEHPNRVP